MCLSIITQGNKERVAKEECGAAKKEKKTKRDKRRVNN